MTAIIAARRLNAGYGGISVIRDLDLEVHPGEVVTLLGANGAGKTTTLLALAGELAPLSGEVRWLGSAARIPLHQRARQGLAFVTEERSVFMGLTARQNLLISRGAHPERAARLFPELDAVLRRRAGLLSGGEQQMLTLARALGRSPRLLLADELSLGLAPRIVGRLLREVRRSADQGMAALVVEQHVHRALEIADRVYVLQRGRLVFQGTAAQARENIDEITGSYLAGAQPG